MAEPAKKKIIWVEDDKLIGALLTKKLIAAGFDIFCALNGHDAFEAMKAMLPAIPDLVMVDLVLPDMNGFEILEKVGADPRYASVPKLILSNIDSAADHKRAEEVGAKKFIVKALSSLDDIVKEVKAQVG
ncbi:MAG: response regulator [Patescibacteria group bacterium]|nr:response regulator [Patescibacteria group bacterium]MDE1966593.1 response regulator [Patescibacteria group bacterium]